MEENVAMDASLPTTTDLLQGNAKPQAEAAAAPTSDDKKMPEPLKSGDLVRISDRGFREVKKLREKGDELGRIVAVHENDADDDGDACVTYDVDWIVVGGTSTHVAFYYLKPTTAAEEGLTVTRRRVKRKPNSFAEDALQMDKAKAKRRAQLKAKKSQKQDDTEETPAAKPTAQKKVAPKNTAVKKAPAKEIKKVATKESKKPAASKKKAPPKKPAAKKAAPATAKRKSTEATGSTSKKRKLSTTPAEPAPEAADNNDSAVAPKGMDLYEKQRREFDRIMTRLEKIDPFGWFLDPVPPEFDEIYDSDVEATETKPENKESSDKSPFPDHAPYNWEMIRRRKDHGRYELDRVAREEKEYLEIMKPYYKSVGRRPKKSTENPRVLYKIGVHWELFQRDVTAMMDAAYDRAEDPTAGGRTSLEMAIKKLKESLDHTVERTGKRQERVLSFYDDRHRYDTVLKRQSNTEAAMQSWRENPFPERRYERLRKDVVSAGLSELDERIATYELKTSLPDSFIGISYRYDDTGQSEAWMQSVVDEAGAGSKGTSQAKEAAMALAADEGVVRAQVVATMQSLLIGVQDRVMTDMSVLHQRELVSANWIESDDVAQQLPLENDHVDAPNDGNFTPEIVEQPVWGMDCYTRRNILICLDADFDPETSLTFVEKWLLPAINACPPDIAHDISNAARILEGLPFQMPSEEDRVEKMIEDENESKSVQQWSHTVLGNALVEKIKTQAPPWLKVAANFIRRARESLGPNFFRVHPKGHGSVLLSQRVLPNNLVTFYRGEIYPAWRWGEKMDAIEITQQRKGLRPTLPDFYNMALERPQMDPRGYGMLFVDASRKGGHGSALSHSCQPTCEVRVAALNGELCLAMTTLRELEMGEELTFDYNAATDSLNEYQSAVCLCGHGKCRGSFLHFATADCYQKVMNRNCPIASRFSNLIKGCMKKVMSDDDDKVLSNHGFRTASFGAISVNRHDGESFDKNLSDSLDIVPVWLKTYAADTLRYIEYERRALPITLICDQMSPTSNKEDRGSGRTATKKSASKGTMSKEPTKPETSFFYFSRRQSDRIGDLLRKKGFDKTGLEMQTAKQKVAAAYWNNLSDEKKAFWKQEAIKDFERKRKAWKAEQTRARKKANAKKARDASAYDVKDITSSGIDFQDADAEGVSAMEHRIQHLTQALSRVGRVLDRHREGKLPQGNNAKIDDSNLRDIAHSPLNVLSDSDVVRRIWIDQDSIVKSLDRYMATGGCVSNELKSEFSEAINRYGPLLEKAVEDNLPSSRDTLKRALLEIRSVVILNLQKMTKHFRKFKAQLSSERDSRSVSPNPARSGGVEDDFEETQKGPPLHTSPGAVVAVQSPVQSDGTEPADQDSQTEKADESKQSTLSDAQEPKGNECADGHSEDHGASRLPDKEADDGSIEDKPLTSDKESNERTFSEVRSLVDEMVCKVEENADASQLGNGEPVNEPSATSTTFSLLKNDNLAETAASSDALLLDSPWIDHYGERVALEAAADVLLMYATTSNFFVINPYANLESTPVEVYARELGNTVPKTVIDQELLSPGDVALLESKKVQTKSKPSESGDQLLCSPDDVVAKVAVQYGGEYVLSQLLQWYNGGIGQKPGLPDLSGCVSLPHVDGCWTSPVVPKKILRGDKKTVYDSKIRQRLIEWLQDPYKRGDPFPDEVKQAFYPTTPDNRPAERILFGSPVLDFLVMGDESNIFEALEELDSENKVATRSALNDALSTVDRGRPAQAVCRWVQCENPDCLKWRKIPWHVDIDLLPETFFCKNNKWDPERMSCDKPEDDWDADDKVVGADGKVEGSPIRQKGQKEPASPSKENDFRVGAKFDVRRKMKGKERFCIATVTHIDFSGAVKRVKFHFQKTSSDADEWVEFGSDRIATLHSMTGESAGKKDKVNATVPGHTKPSTEATENTENKAKGVEKSDLAHKKPKVKSKKTKEGMPAAGNTEKPRNGGMTKKPTQDSGKQAGSEGVKKSKKSKLTKKDKKSKIDAASSASTPKGIETVVPHVPERRKDFSAPKIGETEIFDEYCRDSSVTNARCSDVRGAEPKEYTTIKKTTVLENIDTIGSAASKTRVPDAEVVREMSPKKRKKTMENGFVNGNSKLAKEEPRAPAKLVCVPPRLDTKPTIDRCEITMEGQSSDPTAHSLLHNVPGLYANAEEQQRQFTIDKTTPDSGNSGPRQVTVEKPVPIPAQAMSPRESYQSSPLSEVRAMNDTVRQSQNDSVNHDGFVRQLSPRQHQTSAPTAQQILSPVGLTADSMNGFQDAGQYASQLQPSNSLPFQGSDLADLARQYLHQASPPMPPPAPARDDLNILAALAFGNNNMPNSYGQANPDIEVLLRQARGDPTILLQLQQLLQNVNLFRS